MGCLTAARQWVAQTSFMGTNTLPGTQAAALRPTTYPPYGPPNRVISGYFPLPSPRPPTYLPWPTHLPWRPLPATHTPQEQGQLIRAKTMVLTFMQTIVHNTPTRLPRTPKLGRRCKATTKPLATLPIELTRRRRALLRDSAKSPRLPPSVGATRPTMHFLRPAPTILVDLLD